MSKKEFKTKKDTYQAAQEYLQKNFIKMTEKD